MGMYNLRPRNRFHFQLDKYGALMYSFPKCRIITTYLCIFGLFAVLSRRRTEECALLSYDERLPRGGIFNEKRICHERRRV